MWKLALAGLAIAGTAFASYHAGSDHVRSQWRAAELSIQQEAAAQLAKMQAQVNAANAQTQSREQELLGQLDAERKQTEELRDEISNRPVIRKVVTKTVNGECPAVPAVDWGVFRDLYNRAATGVPAPDPADGGDAAGP